MPGPKSNIYNMKTIVWHFFIILKSFNGIICCRLDKKGPIATRR